MKTVLVTGGAGLIGSHLCKRLLKENNEVICLDNFFTGKKENIKDLIDNVYFEVIRHDITESILLEVDEIYNLACPASPIYYQFNPVKTVETSVSGSINMLELANMVEARILQASTSEIYGDPEEHPQVESYWGNVNPIGSRSCYDEGKRCAETLFFDYYKEKNVDIRVVRIFNTYGPNMNVNDGRVISNFVIQALRGEDLTVYGDGQQTRSFCYVGDLIDGMIKMMNNSEGFIGPVNLGNPDYEITILDLAKKIIELTGSNSRIIHKELPKDDPVRRKPDITLAKTKLNWEPEISIDEGLKRTIKYFKNL